MKVQKVTSRSNDSLVRLRKVRDGKIPGSIFVEGLRLAEEAVRTGVPLLQVAFTPKFAASEKGSELLEKMRTSAARFVEISDDLFRTIADTDRPQGIALVVPRPPTGKTLLPALKNSGKLPTYLFLYQINDPSNLGAILRSAEAAGVRGVILSKGSVDVFSPKALRSGMGANFRIPVWDDCSVEELLEWTYVSGLRKVAADVRGRTSYAELDWTVPSLILLGSEAHGLNDQVLSQVDQVVRIPMQNGVESLNLAVSAGVILFEAVRQNTQFATT